MSLPGYSGCVSVPWLLLPFQCFLFWIMFNLNMQGDSFLWELLPEDAEFAVPCRTELVAQYIGLIRPMMVKFPSCWPRAWLCFSTPNVSGLQKSPGNKVCWWLIPILCCFYPQCWGSFASKPRDKLSAEWRCHVSAQSHWDLQHWLARLITRDDGKVYIW